MFFWNSCFFDDPTDVGNLISGSSTFSKSILNIWKFTVHTLLKIGLENFEHYFASVWDECNCAVVWAFFGIAFLWDRNENWLFPVLWPLLSFPNLLAYWVQHFHSTILWTWNLGLEVGLPSPPLALFVLMLPKADLTLHSRMSGSRWVITPWTEEPGRLQSTGSWRVRHDWATSLWLFTFMHWRRKWQPTLVFLPGKSQGWRRLVGCHLWSRTESDTTEATWQQQLS